jgi:hypothetical protein
MNKLSLIRSLRDQLKGTQQELKTVTAKVDVALSKASRATDAEKFLLEEVENLFFLNWGDCEAKEPHNIY